MNLQNITDLIDPLKETLEKASRSNTQKPQKYWYPLSLATYGLEEILEALDSMCSFRTSMWQKTAAFEAQFARLLNCGEAVMVNSGSSADLLLAFSLRNPTAPLLEAGDEVLVPAVTWPTQVWSVMMAGFKPILVDVDPNTLNIDFNKIDAFITEKTKALFLVHLMGNPCDLKQAQAICEKHNLILLEDTCESLGATYENKHVGTWGWGGSFSFFFSHHITTMEGGMIVCNDPKLADHLRALRAHGWTRDQHNHSQAYNPTLDSRYLFNSWGFNVRPTELQAGFGLRQLERLPQFEERRARYATQFFAFLEKWQAWLTVPQVCPEATPCWFALPLMVAKNAPFTREEIAVYLEKNGVETRPIVTGNIAHQPIMQHFPELIKEELTGADKVHKQGLYIGLSPMQEETAMTRLEEIFDNFLTIY